MTYFTALLFLDVMGIDSETECLLYLRQNIVELKRLGEEWGLSADEINKCIDKSLGQIEEQDSSAVFPKNNARYVWCSFRRCLAFCFKTCLLLSVLLVLLCGCAYAHQPTGHFIGKFLHPHAYDIFRFLRLATLPLHKVTNITYYYDSECIVQNPYFRQPMMDCWMCHNIHDVKEVDSPSQVLINQWISYHRPILFKKTLTKPVGLIDLQQLYHKNAEDLDTMSYQLVSAGNASDIVNLKTLFTGGIEQRILSNTDFHMEWHSWKVLSSKLLRKLFPRPKFVLAEAEVSLKKTVLIDGHHHKHYKLPSSDNLHTWYTQGSGTHQLVLSPVDNCKQECSTFQTLLRPGDTLLFSHYLWKVDALSSGDTISVGFIGSFSV
ncbi:hypothetical protein ScPMuIL_016150 [Solemya velum]